MNKSFFLLNLTCVFSFLVFGCGNGRSHEGFKKKFSEKFSEQYTLNEKVITPNKAELQNFVKVVDYLPSGYSKLGDTDYTNIIQSLLDRFSNIEFPNFPILINDSGLNLRSNSKLYFQKKSTLKLKSSDKILYSILNIKGARNVIVYSPRIEGDRYRRINPEDENGEWGMGIWIRESKNISIYNAKVSRCWGDGIYIGGGNVNIKNDSIYFYKPIVDENRRNGISITNGKNITLIEPLVSNTHGTSPESGIDIEPNNNNATLDNIYIESPKTFNNKTHGIVVSLSGLVGELDKNVNIEIVNHIDEYSTYGFTIASFRRDKLETDKKLNGSIIIKNPIWKFNKHAYGPGNTKNLYPSINFMNSKIYSDVNNEDTINEKILNKLKSETNKNGIFFN